MQALPRLRRGDANTTSYVADYLTRSVRRATGLVLVGNPEVGNSAANALRCSKTSDSSGNVQPDFLCTSTSQVMWRLVDCNDASFRASRGQRQINLCATKCRAFLAQRCGCKWVVGKEAWEPCR